MPALPVRPEPGAQLLGPPASCLLHSQQEGAWSWETQGVAHEVLPEEAAPARQAHCGQCLQAPSAKQPVSAASMQTPGATWVWAYSRLQYIATLHSRAGFHDGSLQRDCNLLHQSLCGRECSISSSGTRASPMRCT